MAISTTRTRSGKFVVFAETKPHVEASLRPVSSVRSHEVVQELTDEMEDALWCAYSVGWDTLREDPVNRQTSSLRRRLLLDPPVPLNRDSSMPEPVAYLDPEQHFVGYGSPGDDRSVKAVLSFLPARPDNDPAAEVLLSDGSRERRYLDQMVVDLP
jgi:hypothetical protein